MSYQELKSYRQAMAIQDYTVEFCKIYVSKFSRTTDQMIQAARSGKQNIVEGCSVSKTSPQTELKLIGVARGSLEELLEDYKDFLRQKGLEIWRKDDPRAVEVRNLAYRPDMTDRADKSDMSDKPYRAGEPDRTDMSNRADKTDRADKACTTYTSYKSYESYQYYLKNPESAGNAMIVLINQTNYLLDQQMKAVRKQMEEKGISSFSHQEKLRRILEDRKKKNEEFDKWLKTVGQNKSE
ncbi:MAG: topoisomerase, type IA, zn finger domain protein [Parcubacteria group bacterium GW2011_GWA2_38_13]|nr:MAG: topoisomerase, type IA, zn finger domain protein [Parcubacteria group bacterium GW2011_GWA2_38_13]